MQQRRSTFVAVRVTPDEAARLTELSQQTLRTRSDILRLLLHQAEARGWDVVLKQPQEACHA